MTTKPQNFVWNDPSTRASTAGVLFSRYKLV